MTPPLPLSQQILAWLLVALGYGDERHPNAFASPGTVKNARRGKPILRSWASLVQAVAGALGSDPDEVQLRQVTEGLRAWDAEVGALPAPALPSELKMAPILSCAGPALGIRAGVLAALLGLHARPELREDLREVLTDPLAPGFFGGVVTLILKQHRPDWSTREQRSEGLEGVVDARTLERWRDGTLRVPAPSTLTALVDALGVKDELAKRVELGLRAARVLCCLRRDLEKWSAADQLEQLQRLTAMFARSTERALRGDENLRALAVAMAEMLELPEGAHIVQRFFPHIDEAKGRMVADTAASLLREESARWCGQEGGVAEKTLLLLLQLIEPLPLLRLAVFGSLGAEDVWLGYSRPFTQILREHWHQSEILRAIEHGTILRIGPEGEEERVQVPPQVREYARKAVEQQRCVLREKAGPGELNYRASAVMSMVSGLVGRDEAFKLLQSVMSVSPFVRALPDEVERIAPDEFLQHAPNLLLPRALRLAREGELKSACEFVGRWTKSPHLKSPSELALVAEVFAELAHQQLDVLIPCIHVSRQLRAQLCGFGGEDCQRLRGLCADSPRQAADTLTRLDGLMERARELLKRSGLPETEVLIARLLLPLSVRLDIAEALLVDDDVVPLRRAQEHADTVPQLIEASPTDGHLHALQASWQELIGKPDRQARKQAVHYGCGALVDELSARFDRDLGLSEDAGEDVTPSK